MNRNPSVAVRLEPPSDLSVGRTTMRDQLLTCVPGLAVVRAVIGGLLGMVG